MADAAAARREARRRRILENSDSRLKIISGKGEEDSAKEPPSRNNCSDVSYEALSVSDSSNFCPSPIYNGVIPTPEPLELLSAPSDPTPAGDANIVNDLAGLLSSASVPAPSKSPWERIFTYKYDIVILASIIQILYSLFIFENAYFFLPLMLYSGTKLMWYPQQPQSNIANVLLLLNGITASKAQRIMNIMQWLGVISQDVCIYLFTTICIQSLIITLQDSVFT